MPDEEGAPGPKSAEVASERGAPSPFLFQGPFAGGYRSGPGGCELFCRFWEGEKTIAVLLALHDLGGHGEWYESLAQDLIGRSLAVLAPDMRGHGLTRWDLGRLPKTSLLLRDVEFWAGEIAAALPGIPVFLVGTGLGGALALAAAQRIPDLRGLVLLSPTLEARDLTWAEKANMAGSLLFGREGGAPTPLGRGLAISTDALRLQWLRKDPLALAWVPALSHWRARSLIRHARRAADHPFTPLLCVQGAQDPVARPGENRRRFEKRTGARFVLWEQGAHDLALEADLAPLTGVVADWIRHHVAQASDPDAPPAPRSAGAG